MLIHEASLAEALCCMAIVVVAIAIEDIFEVYISECAVYATLETWVVVAFKSLSCAIEHQRGHGEVVVPLLTKGVGIVGVGAHIVIVVVVVARHQGYGLFRVILSQSISLLKNRGYILSTYATEY